MQHNLNLDIMTIVSFTLCIHSYKKYETPPQKNQSKIYRMYNGKKCLYRNSYRLYMCVTVKNKKGACASVCKAEKYVCKLVKSFS